MKIPPAQRLSRILLRLFMDGRYRDSLEGDLLEESAAGRAAPWFWRQVACALWEHARFIARRQILPLMAVTLFFLVALSAIAPATYPLMEWARTLDSLRFLVLPGWLAGVPLVLGGIAGAGKQRRRGVILLAAGVAYLTPAALPFDSAVCDLCASPGSVAPPDVLVLLTPVLAALLAASGAGITGRRHTHAH